MRKEIFLVVVSLAGILLFAGCDLAEWTGDPSSEWDYYHEAEEADSGDGVLSHYDLSYCTKLALLKDVGTFNGTEIEQPDPSPSMFEKIEQDTPYKIKLTLRSLVDEGNPHPLYPRVDGVAFEWRSEFFTTSYTTSGDGSRIVSNIDQDNKSYVYECAKIDDKTYECAMNSDDKLLLQNKAGIFFLSKVVLISTEKGLNYSYTDQTEFCSDPGTLAFTRSLDGFQINGLRITR